MRTIYGNERAMYAKTLFTALFVEVLVYIYCLNYGVEEL